jgi:hypothetical protein
MSKTCGSLCVGEEEHESLQSSCATAGWPLEDSFNEKALFAFIAEGAPLSSNSNQIQCLGQVTASERYGKEAYGDRIQ